MNRSPQPLKPGKDSDMATATVPQPTTSGKPTKAFYAHLYDQPGVLAKVEGVIYFMQPDTGTITAVEPAMCTFLTVLGEIGLADTQRLMDELHGGLVTLCTSRAN
jgi:hypothetical protein